MLKTNPQTEITNLDSIMKQPDSKFDTLRWLARFQESLSYSRTWAYDTMSCWMSTEVRSRGRLLGRP